jgi:hypothetical protein
LSGTGFAHDEFVDDHHGDDLPGAGGGQSGAPGEFHLGHARFDLIERIEVAEDVDAVLDAEGAEFG